jgi:hypothetical protein
MSGFRSGIAPVIRQAIRVSDRCIQSFVQVELVNAHDVHVDVGVSRSIWHIHAVKYMDATPLAKRMMGYRVFAPVLRQCAITEKKTKVFRPNLDEPESQSATEAAVAFHRTLAEIDPGFKPHRLAMATSAVCPQHRALSWFWIRLTRS